MFSGAGWADDPIEAVERDGSAMVVRLRGELDLANVDRVREALLETAAGDGIDRLVLDLSKVAFVDSTVLGMLVEVRRALGDRPLALVAPGAEVVRALEVTGLIRHLAVHPSVAAALKS